jgi:5-formaminoimidazole-4-carboxamide-1-(beta)-D-ribofuranosyl 5'-monophosphate synthetase
MPRMITDSPGGEVMIDRNRVLESLEKYDLSKAKIGVLGSHSALDVCDGAVDEGFQTMVICEKGREEPYTRYFKAERSADGTLIRGMVDRAVVFDKFDEILEPKNQDMIIGENAVFAPHRSLVAYAGIDGVENDFYVPIVGSRNLLRSEERGEDRDYYWMLEKMDMPFPKKLENPEDIDSLVMVKLPHKVKRLERGFFTAASYKEYVEKVEALLRNDVITKEDLEKARIEEYIVGPVFNFDFFYSPLTESGEKLELLGIDWRFETSLDGHVRLPAPQQVTLLESQATPEYTVCGHNSATLRESLLRKVFPLAEKYVEGTIEYCSPGMIGAFTLQTCVDKDLDFWIYDVSPRVGGGTNVHLAVGHPYGNAIWRTPMSTGRRLALEIRRGIEMDAMEKIVT